ncbi:Cytochrome P450 71A1 [Zea mays]|uniref:Cytochrome P450 71A1 n=1 Tax=Zea mays TaxID=4577 RepID=A0A3L6DLT2_MAIZE|nr:Cytochrome P450 71A1 [Zea mays]
MALEPVALLLTVLVAAPLTVLLLLFLVAGNKRPARAASPTPRHRLRLPLPPSPRGLPLLGHLHLLGSLPHRALASLARAHGPVLLLRLGRVPTVVVSSAAAAEEVMRARDLAFANRPASAMAERLLYGRDVAFAPYGEYWRQARRVCVVHLLSARHVGSFRRVREQEAAALVARVARDSAGGAAVGLSDLLTEYANAVVSRAAFGDESARGLLGEFDSGRRQRKVLTDFQKLVGTTPVGELLPWLGWVDAVTGLEGKIRRTFEALDGLLEKVIDDHRRRPRSGEDGGDRDFVDVLLDVHNKDQEHGIQLETNEIKAIILDMFAAGTDTIATAMEWAMAELVTHPRAMRRAQDEVRAVAAGSTGVNEDHVAQLDYLKAVLKETLRLHAPLPLLVPGSRRRTPRSWERFLGGAAAADVGFKGQHFELLPFGAGRRMCPGIAFAEGSAEMALASLLYHFDWEAASRGQNGKGTPSLDMTEMNGLAVHINSGLPLVAKPWIPLKN